MKELFRVQFLENKQRVVVCNIGRLLIIRRLSTLVIEFLLNFRYIMHGDPFERVT